MDDGKRNQETARKQSRGTDEYRGEAYTGPLEKGSSEAGKPAGDGTNGGAGTLTGAETGGNAGIGNSIKTGGGVGISGGAKIGNGAKTGGSAEIGGGKSEYTLAAPVGAMTWAQEAGAAVFSDERKRDPEAEFLANAARRAHDEELAALASLALIRSGMAQRDKQQSSNNRRQNQPPTQEELNERLRRILEDTDVPPSRRHNR